MPIISYAQLHAAMVFCKRHFVAPFLLTVLCCFLYLEMGDLAAQYATKLVTDAIILYFIFSLNPARLYYYYNMHLSKRMIIIIFLIADMLSFSLCLWITSRFT